MNLFSALLATCLLVLGRSVSAQAPPQPEMKTFSPYTSEQIKAFNQQGLSPTEGVFGPVNGRGGQQIRNQKPPFDSQFFNIPVGEQEAEAQETESAEPYQPETPTISF